MKMDLSKGYKAARDQAMEARYRPLPKREGIIDRAALNAKKTARALSRGSYAVAQADFSRAESAPYADADVRSRADQIAAQLGGEDA